ncbi:MAG: chemotaxis protein CheW [Myxococcota bacterium]|nr:chemotaxis protein CheW [Myxococcota bacterium]
MTISIIPSANDSRLLRRQSRAAAPADTADGKPLGFLCFTLDDQQYGVDLNLVCQIVKPPPLTWVPRRPPHILGIVSIRGAVVTLVDLRQLIDLEPTPWPRTARVLIVEMGNEPIGLLVDRVTQVRRLAAADLEKQPDMGEGPLENYVTYVARPAGEKRIVIVDLDLILSQGML